MRGVVLPILLSLIDPLSVFAEPPTDEVRVVEAEAIYVMGDSDTLAAAEENVLQRAKRKAVEATGVYIEATSTDIEKTNGEHTKHLNSLGIRTIAAALTETEILDKRRALEDGRLVLSIKIRTKVHVEWLKDAVRRLKDNEQLAEHHRQLHAEYNQMRAELDRLQSQMKSGAQDGMRIAAAGGNRRLARQLLRTAVDSHDIPQKIDFATRAIAADEKYADAYVVRGQTYLRIASLTYTKKEKRSELSAYVERAVTDFDHALAIAPRSTWALLGRGDAYTWQRKLREAAQDYEQAVDIDPLFDVGRQRLIALYTAEARRQTESGRSQEALQTLNRLLSGESQLGWVVYQKDAYLLRSKILQQIGDDERAVHDLTMVLSVDPTNADAFLQRAKLHQRLRQGRLAKEDFERACGLGRDEACGALR